ncbi:MAG: MATE family efflux transporter [Bernardetiaceae bacterium]|nr:MATE family efflux transporter [Bernardetiaceae bacterium]
MVKKIIDNAQLKQLFSLSYPIILGQLATVFMMTADTVMVGNYDTIALAAVSFSNNIFMIFMIAGMGVGIGIKPLAAAAHAQAKTNYCRLLLQNGILIWTIIGIAFALFFHFAMPHLLHFMNQPPEVEILAQQYLKWLGYALLPIMVFNGLQQFSEALGFSRQPMMLNVIGNLLNALFNYLLIFGIGIFPEMGLIGAGVATLLARIAMLIMIVVLFSKHATLKKFMPRKIKMQKIPAFKLLKTGLPIGMQLSFEVGAFSMAGIMVGWIGTEALAAHQVVLTISVVSFLTASGIGQGATTQIADYMGKMEFRKLRRAGFHAIGVIIAFMTLCAVFIILFRNQLPAWYIDMNDDNALDIAAIAVVLLFIVSLYQLSDGIQVVVMGILRGMEDIKIPTAITLFAYWGVGMPAGYALAFYADLGVQGVWFGLLIGLTVAAVLLTWRFHKLTKKRINA